MKYICIRKVFSVIVVSVALMSCASESTPYTAGLEPYDPEKNLDSELLNSVQIDVFTVHGAHGCKECILYPFTGEDGAFHVVGEQLVFDDSGRFAYTANESRSVAPDQPTVGVLWSHTTQSFCGTHTYSDIEYMMLTWIIEVLPHYDHTCPSRIMI